MTASGPVSGNAGYRLERIHVAEQAYASAVRDDIRETDDHADRMVQFGWDWRPLTERRFEVVLEISCHPIKVAPESARVRLFGVFSADPGVPSIPFASFVRVNALAILFPYAREVISTMTGRGPYGAFHLNPVNVQTLAEELDIEDTTGAAFFREHPDMAEAFGLEYRLRDNPALKSGAKREV